MSEWGDRARSLCSTTELETDRAMKSPSEERSAEFGFGAKPQKGPPAQGRSLLAAEWFRVLSCG